jgi:glycosyltransferase involved in cell wall biosynthesis
MRLLIFSPYFPPHVGGLEGYVRDLNDELIRLRLVDAITVLTPRIPPDGAPAERLAEGYCVVRHPAVDLIPNFPCPALWRLGFWRGLRPFVQPRRHDLVICHTRFFLSSLAALIYSRVSGLPLIHVEHGADYVHLESPLRSAVARLYDATLGRLVLCHAQAVVAISQAAARFVEQLAGREAQVIYRGVDHVRYEAIEPSAELLAWAAGRPVVTFVGRLIDGKGVADLVEAFAGLDDSRAVLCIVGDGPRRSELEALCASHVPGDRCRFVGYQAEGRALEFMRGSAVVVNPSYTEGLPTSVLEAALLGRAILASNVGGTPEVVADRRSALLFPAGDLEALRAGMAMLLADPGLRSRLGAAARAEVIARFDRSAGARRFAELARHLVVDGPANGAGRRRRAHRPGGASAEESDSTDMVSSAGATDMDASASL